mgnify:CR=1 FL=1
MAFFYQKSLIYIFDKKYKFLYEKSKSKNSHNLIFCQLFVRKHEKSGNLAKNWNLVINRNFGQKLKFYSKIEILVKNWNLVINGNFGQTLNFYSQIEILFKNSKSLTFCQLFVRKPTIMEFDLVWLHYFLIRNCPTRFSNSSTGLWK